MREIKFRAWCVNKNEWEKDLIMITPNGGICQLKDYIHIPCKPETHIIQLFTGLKDKNGKEIYEGDIVKGIIYDQERIAQIVFKESFGGFFIDGEDSIGNTKGFLFMVGSRNDEIEVIGNIYENSELLPHPTLTGGKR